MARSVTRHEFQPDLTGPADPYKRLGVPRDAKPEDVKRAWRRVAQIHHPDHGGDPQVFAELKLCYEILIDPVRRREFDATGVMKQVQPDTLLADAINVMLMAFERVLGALNQSRTEPRHVDMISRIADMLQTMESEKFKEEAHIKQSLPEWESIAKRFRRKKGGDNVFERHILANVARMKTTLDAVERHKKALKLARTLIREYDFDVEQMDTYEINLQRVMGRGFVRVDVS